MNIKKSKRYLTWMRQAEFDLQAAKVSLEHTLFEWAAYQCEQSVEKALKAVIVQAGMSPPKLHKLSVLFGYCNSVNPEFRETKFQFRHVESFTFISRYPFLLPDGGKTPHELISKNDAQACVDEAENIIVSIREILGKDTGIEEFKLPAAISQSELETRIKDVTDILVREFDPEQIVLFGSYARKTLPTDLSTMDVLVVANTDLDFIARIKKAREVTRGNQPSIEPLVYTPEEFQTMTEEEGESFIEGALAEGRVLYTKE